MGVEVDRVEFTAEDHQRFAARLRDELVALAEVLRRPGFGEGPATIGAELELSLVGDDARPRLVNDQVLATARDPRVGLEIDAFNLEINTPPLPLAGRPFEALRVELEDALSVIRRAAAQHGARPIAIGILPTVSEEHLAHGVLSARARYAALSRAIRDLHGGPFPLHIEGEDTLDVVADDVSFEGATTSFQVHLRVPPRAFASAYNAALIATGPLLAVACNAPLFLGRRLWDETRVALFRQATDDRRGALEGDWRPGRVSFGHGFARVGALELFAESVALHAPVLPVVDDEEPIACARAGGVPRLSSLRVHHGTVWRWNRAVYDDTAGGHLRIELRALPAGPTTIDMVANAAFAIGLVLGLAPRVESLLPGFLFGHARRNFYEAARHGLDAEILWPARAGERVTPRRAGERVPELIAIAREGLVDAGVDRAEASRWLDVVAARADAGVTGARWQRRALERLGGARPAALARLVEAYLIESASGRAVHSWASP